MEFVMGGIMARGVAKEKGRQDVQRQALAERPQRRHLGQAGSRPRRQGE
jgi:hypothetical protein